MSDATDNLTLTAVPGFMVGHHTHPQGVTGSTVIIGPESGMCASGLVLGGGPASREFALLDPARMMERIDALLLTGGSAFGLAAADGVMTWLAENGRGYETMAGRVPIVPAAAIFDLMVASDGQRPDASFGYKAAAAASSGPVAEGRVGAGAGATAGAYLGIERAVRTGIGSSAVRLDTPAGVVTVGALVVANPAGDIYSPRSGELLAGQGLASIDLARHLSSMTDRHNTTLVAVATDARLSKSQAAGLAVSAHAGLARAVRPSHTPFDGDTAFVLSSNVGPTVSTAVLAVLVQDVVVSALERAAAAGRS